MGMGSSGDTRSAEEKRLDEEAKKLQNERLKREEELAARQKKEQEAMLKAQRGSGGASLLDSENDTVVGSGYGSLLGD